MTELYFIVWQMACLVFMFRRASGVGSGEMLHNCNVGTSVKGTFLQGWSRDPSGIAELAQREAYGSLYVVRADYLYGLGLADYGPWHYLDIVTVTSKSMADNMLLQHNELLNHSKDQPQASQCTSSITHCQTTLSPQQPSLATRMASS
jgi:hypothetical protein